MYPGRDGLQVDDVQISTRGHEPAARIKGLLYPLMDKKEEVTTKEYNPLTFENVWLDSQFEPYRDNYEVLDQRPSSNLLHRALGSFSETSELLDDDDDGAVEAMKLMPLPLLLQRSVMAPLLTQISLVNSGIVSYFMEELQIHKHFDIFRNFLFLEDGEFALSLSDQLFEKIASGVTPRELCCPTVLNDVVSRALQLSVYTVTEEHVQNLAFALKWVPEMFKPNEISSLDFLELRYKVAWPVNIVITENSVIKYNKIFSFMLKLKRLSWILRDIWFHLKHVGHSRQAAGSPQLRHLQLFRSEDPYITLVYEISKGLVERIVNPLLQPEILFKMTSKGRKFFQNCTYAKEKANKVIQERREALKDRAEQESLRQKKHLDFLDILLEAKDDQDNGFTDEEIREEVVTFMFAGYDTTASAISWALYNLARFPEHQKKCQDEIDAVFKDKEELEWQDLGNLNYLQLCIKESMRIFAPVPVISRSLDKTFSG